MKRKIAFLVLAIVALTATLAACNTATTTLVVRWNESEEYTFNITLADFDNSETPTAFFKQHVSDGTTYYKDVPISSQEVVSLSTSKELRPENAAGTYVYSIKRSSGSGQGEVTTTQNLYVQYKTEDLQKFECWKDLQKLEVAKDSAENPFTEHDGLTTLKSVMTTNVKFADDTNQRPISSSTTLNGFYLGEFQSVSDYAVTTEYNFNDNIAKVTLTKNGVKGDTQDVKLSVANNRNFIDSNQILTYLRSLEKSSSSFQDSPSVTVFNPLGLAISGAQNVTTTATFILTYDQKAVLNNNGTAFYTSLNAVGVTIGGSPYMMQMNLPDRLAAKDKDVYNTVGDTKYSKYTTVKFRTGYLSYELASYDQDTLTALNAKD